MRQNEQDTDATTADRRHLSSRYLVILFIGKEKEAASISDIAGLKKPLVCTAVPSVVGRAAPAIEKRLNVDYRNVKRQGPDAFSPRTGRRNTLDRNCHSVDDIGVV